GVVTSRGAIFFFTVRKTTKPAEVPPIGRTRIAAELFGESTRNGGRGFFGKDSSVIQPGLKVLRRRFENERRRESGVFKARQSLGSEIIDQREGMFAFRT